MIIDDINKEYEKRFGVTLRKNLYSADDEEYQTLRQSIINAGRVEYKAEGLLFKDIDISSPFNTNLITSNTYKYEEQSNPSIEEESIKEETANIDSNNTDNRIQIIKENISKAIYDAKGKGYHVFVIQESGLYYAWGYFSHSCLSFYIGKYSLLAPVSNGLDNTRYNYYRRNFLTKSCSDIGSFFVVDKDTKCSNHVLAELYVVGKIDTSKYWRDNNGVSASKYLFNLVKRNNSERSLF